MKQLSIEIINAIASSFIDTEAQLKVLDSTGKFTEGPVWHPEGFYLFSDITLNNIFKYSEEKGKENFLSNSGTSNVKDEDLNEAMAGSNGLAWNKQMELLVCRHGSHEVAKLKEGKLQTIIGEFEGRPLNSPNDIICDGSGRIWFSDPPYGLKDGKLNPERYQSKARVYCFSGEKLIPVSERYKYPNGLCFSPDESKVYIVSNKPDENFISVYDTQSLDLLQTIKDVNSDGLKCDEKGNLYGASKEGIVVLSSEGEKLAVITLPEIAANLCFGGTEGKDLFITARQHIFLIRGFLK